MSTIKSSNEHLTLNADGSGKDIKFQSNGSEVASISDGGVVTATTFTGASTDATKLPLAGGSITGNVNFGDNVKAQFGDANDLNIYHNGTHSIIQDSGSGDLKIWSSKVEIQSPDAGENIAIFNDDGDVQLYHNNVLQLQTTATGLQLGNSSASPVIKSVHSMSFQIDSDNNATGQQYTFRTNSTAFSGGTELFTIKDNGRVVSQSNAHAWLSMNGTGSIAIKDSYNVSSIADNGTGNYDMNFDVDMANDDYASAGMHGQFAGSLAPLNLFVGTFNFRSNDDNAAATDDANITVMCFGDTA
tara:strand:- start:362 stop:1264 length:903 start_codon:yes stop_codon:yes gene_type:complete